MTRKILVIFDGSGLSIKALSYALAFSREGDEIDLLYIVDKNTYESILKGIESMGGGEEELGRAVSDLEHRFRKQISMFIQECKDTSIKVNTSFKVGEINGEILKEVGGKEYDLVVIPYSENYRDRLGRILVNLMGEYGGNILIVK